MCKIDLPRKNMVIERERARGRTEGGREAAGNQHTRTHTHTFTEVHTLKRWKECREKVLAWVEWKKKKLSLLLTSSPSH